MGYNISGLVIDHNYEKDLKNFEYDFGWNAEIIEEISYEEASANRTPEGEFRLHFTDKATLIFFHHSWADKSYHSSHSDTLNYSYNATGMSFQLDLFKKGKRVRSILEVERDLLINEGRKIALEKKHKNADGLTFALIDKLLGAPFNSIALQAIAYRCKTNNNVTQLHRLG